MVVRELKDGSVIVSTQEDHAELAAQFAAHWGNERFSRLRPYSTMILATLYHDSGYREWEGNPPVHVEKGRPYAFREDNPLFEPVELKGYMKNVEWVGSRDPYAGLLVSMHRSGLWENRYNVFTRPAGRVRERSPAVLAAKKELESRQEQIRRGLAAGRAAFDDELAYNYRALQIFDLLSLYFCCDGRDADGRFKEYAIAPVRVAYETREEVELRLIPHGPDAVRVDPYPFDLSPLRVAARARLILPVPEKTEEAALEAYHKAPRRLLEFEVRS
ncbi:MAG TPA: DUF3891 family protein [candidate division Zixibacteria bacterium]|nr:DUF3891 family protein [candidate division Zixibacteria bacterium]